MSDYVCGCGSEEIAIAVCEECEADDLEQADKNIERIKELEARLETAEQCANNARKFYIEQLEKNKKLRAALERINGQVIHEAIWLDDVTEIKEWAKEALTEDDKA